MNFLWIFIDGIGIGRDDPSINPFAAVETNWFTPLRGDPELLVQSGSHMKPIDSTLGQPGIPQSATGQTSCA